MTDFVLIRRNSGVECLTGAAAEQALHNCAAMVDRNWITTTEYKDGKEVGELVFDELIEEALGNDVLEEIKATACLAFKNATEIVRRNGHDTCLSESLFKEANKLREMVDNDTGYRHIFILNDDWTVEMNIIGGINAVNNKL